MQRARGFTLIELLITITIMVILMTLAVANIRSTLANARDQERKTDVENIARGLEQRYTKGNSKAKYDTKGSYPGVYEIMHVLGSMDEASICPSFIHFFTPCYVEGGYLTELLPGTTEESFRSPGNTEVMFEGLYYPASNPGEVGPADIDTDTSDGYYIYEPLTRTGGLCVVTDCVRYKLYYKTEVDGQLHTVESRNQ